MFSATRNKGKVGQQVAITLRDGRKAQGKLVELDDQNLVLEIASEPEGLEEVFRVDQVAELREGRVGLA